MLLGLGQSCLQPALPLGKLAPLALQRRAPRLAGGAGLGHLLQAGFRRGQLGAGGAVPRFRLGLQPDLGFGGTLQRLLLFAEPRERGIGIGEMLGLPLPVGPDLRQPPLGLGLRGNDAAKLLLQRLARMRNALRRRCRRRRRHAQLRQRRFHFGAGALRRQRVLGGSCGRTLGGAQFGADPFGLGRGAAPARVEQLRLAEPDLLAEPAIALRLPRLLL